MLRIAASGKVSTCVEGILCKCFWTLHLNGVPAEVGETSTGLKALGLMSQLWSGVIAAVVAACQAQSQLPYMCRILPCGMRFGVFASCIRIAGPLAEAGFREICLCHGQPPDRDVISLSFRSPLASNLVAHKMPCPHSANLCSEQIVHCPQSSLIDQNSRNDQSSWTAGNILLQKNSTKETAILKYKDT